MRMAANAGASLVLRALRLSGIFRRWLRGMLEHVQHSRPLSGLQPSVALDGMSELLRMVAARRLVREAIETQNGSHLILKNVGTPRAKA
jgi:hypothetical protein